MQWDLNLPTLLLPASDLVQHGLFEPGGYLAGLQLQNLAVGNFGEPGMIAVLCICGIIENISHCCVRLSAPEAMKTPAGISNQDAFGPERSLE